MDNSVHTQVDDYARTQVDNYARTQVDNYARTQADRARAQVDNYARAQARRARAQANGNVHARTQTYDHRAYGWNPCGPWALTQRMNSKAYQRQDRRRQAVEAPRAETGNRRRRT
ncbi:hypothetical protein B0H19DRAFT_1188106 [Mycena capillaripes]|nr:hypothetical protein B0H19DRAFT_1188106 [Mycena capillaripes]